MLLSLKPLRYVFYRILTWKLRDPRERTPVVVSTVVGDRHRTEKCGE
jgi:hypothetical protein